MADENIQYPIPVKAFVKTLVGSHDEVFSRLLLIEHANQNKTPTDWQAALDKLRGLPDPEPAPEKADPAPAQEAAKPDAPSAVDEEHA